MTGPLPGPVSLDTVGTRLPGNSTLRTVPLWIVAVAAELATATHRVIGRTASSTRNRATLVLCVTALGYVLSTFAVRLPPFDPAVGPPLLFVAGTAVRDDPSDEIEELTETVERLEAGEYDIDTTTDRDDGVGRLYAAIDELADTLREREQNERYRRELCRIASAPGSNSDAKIRQLLELGRDRFDVETGFLSTVDADTGRYEIEAVSGTESALPDEETDLSEMYCERPVTAGDDVLAIHNAPEEDWNAHPAYDRSGIACYLGGKVRVDGELYGTLCFVDRESHETPFGREERAFVARMARWMGRLLERRELERQASLFDTVLERIPLYLYVKDEQARIVRLSDRFVDVLATNEYPDDREWYQGKTDLEIFPEEFASETYRDDMRVIADGEPVIDRVEYNPKDELWLLTSKVPWRDEGDVRGLIGVTQDITVQKQREVALEALHDLAQELLATETEAEAADLIVETAADVLDASGVALYLLDTETNRLDPIAHSGPVLDDELPAVPASGDSLLWNCYTATTPTVFDEIDRGSPEPLAPDDASGVVMPVGDHGVFVAMSKSTIDDESRRLAETLVASAEAALDRIEYEDGLRERDEELESRNRRLERQIKINEIIRSIGQSLVGATSQDGIEQLACDRLVETENVAFAWIGDFERDELEPRAWAGADPDYLDAVSLDASSGSREPSVTAASTETPAIASNVLDELKAEPWRKSALAHDYHSVVAVPLIYDDYVYGVLAVYAEEPGFFGDLECEVFAELGESIANSINAVKTRKALYADTALELTLRIEVEDADALLPRIARETDCEIEYEGIGFYSSDRMTLFFTTRGTDPGDVQALLDELVSVRKTRLIDASDDEALFEVTVSGGAIAPKLIHHGADLQSMYVDGKHAEIVVRVSTATNVREFVETLRDLYPSTELVGRRDVERETRTEQEFATSLLAGLTDRQRAVLRTAYLSGFFDWPRKNTGEEIAMMLDVSQPTVNRHLRLAQQRLLAELFERERAIETT